MALRFGSPVFRGSNHKIFWRKLMKKIFLLAGLLALVSCPDLNAHEQQSAKEQKEQKVYCCHDRNNCDKLHTRAECEKEGGKVVNNCRECK